MGEKSGKRIKVIQMGGGHGKVNIDTKKTWYKIVRVKQIIKRKAMRKI